MVPNRFFQHFFYSLLLIIHHVFLVIILFSLAISCRGEKIDLIFVLDSSTSVTEANFVKMKNFVSYLLAEAELGPDPTQVGLITYSNNDTIQFHLDDIWNKQNMLKELEQLRYTPGNTNTAAALRTMREIMFSRQKGDRPRVRNVAIVMTDGVSNIQQRRTIPEANAARSQGIEIYAIGIGLGDDVQELGGIADRPFDEHVFTVDDFDELENLRGKVMSRICSSSCNCGKDFFHLHCCKNISFSEALKRRPLA